MGRARGFEAPVDWSGVHTIDDEVIGRRADNLSRWLAVEHGPIVQLLPTFHHTFPPETALRMGNSFTKKWGEKIF